VRLLDLAARDAALLLFDDGRLPHWNQEEVQRCVEHIPHLQVVPILHPHAPVISGFRDPDGSVWRAWGQERSDARGRDTAALVRPDGFVGWMYQNPSLAALRAGLALALGVREGNVNDSRLAPH
jgi:hypothetical protein